MEILLLAMAIFHISSFVWRTVFTQYPYSVFIHHHHSGPGLFLPNINNDTVHSSSESTLKYSRDFLLSMKHSPMCYISDSVLHVLQRHCLCKQRTCLNKKRRRGKRGGRRKQRQIKTIHLPHIYCEYTAHTPTGVNIANLTQVRASNVLVKQPPNLQFLYFNAQSCKNKAHLISDTLLELKADLVFITETWLRAEGDEPTLNEMVPNGYKILSVPRASRVGGGVAIIYRSSLKVTICHNGSQLYNSFEVCSIRVSTTKGNLFCACVYRPPPSKKNKCSASFFLQEFSDFLDFINDERNFYILGDFNFHYERPTDQPVKNLKTLFEEHEICQLVSSSTHTHGHILDLVLCRGAFRTVSDINVSDVCLSDHFILSFQITAPKSQAKTCIKECRNLKRLDIMKFKDSLQRTLSEGPPRSVDSFNQQLRDTLDLHAPLCKKVVPDRPAAPWLSSRVQEAKQNRRKAERQWRKTGLTIHKDIYKQKSKISIRIMKEEKAKYYNEQIACSGSCKDLYAICNQLLGRKKEQTLPKDTPVCQLPEVFNNFFVNKIRNIREELDIKELKEPDFEEFTDHSFSKFAPVTESFVRSIIVKSPKKVCELDPLPASLFFECLDTMLPHITHLINKSLEHGVVPSCFKEAIVIPLIKKCNLNENELKNYRPVSNLPFLSKILEKVVLSQLNTHLCHHDLKEKLQSAYKSKHSTETALLKVQTDLLQAADDGKVSVLALLDLSAAFDTIDHRILLARLDRTFGIKGTVLKWFASYITGRHQSVVIGDSHSAPSELHFGVPQGSVLGPILFSLYSQSLCSILTKHGFFFHQYADDTQIYKSAQADEVANVIDSLNECISDVSIWMASNKLKLNESKTEVMIVGTQQKVRSAGITSVHLAKDQIAVANSARNLGVIMDSTLSMEHHIAHLRKICYLELRRISQIRPLITKEAANKLVCSFVLSRLDYCNSLLSGLPATQLHRLQQVQNNAARVVMRVSRREHVTPLLRELHWLPITSRISYKLSSVVYQCLNDSEFPGYLRELLNLYTPRRSLRSTEGTKLLKPRTRLKTFGDRALPSQAAEIWNVLPSAIQLADSVPNFKKNMKTFLFKQYFNQTL